MLLTLFPGERATITVSTEAELTHNDLTSPPVLRNANQLVTAARATPNGRDSVAEPEP